MNTGKNKTWPAQEISETKLYLDRIAEKKEIAHYLSMSGLLADFGRKLERIGWRKEEKERESKVIFEKVKCALPSALWDKVNVLPAFVPRHINYSNGKAEYSSSYPVVGYSKCMDIESGPIQGLWIEFLVPWPWFIALVIRPEDDKFNLSSGRYFYLLYGDENGLNPFRYPENMEPELMDGLMKLRVEPAMAIHGPPQFNKEAWFKPIVEKVIDI